MSAARRFSSLPGLGARRDPNGSADQSQVQRTVRVLVLLAVLWSLDVEAQAAGSWVADIDELVAAVAGRWAVTPPLKPAAAVVPPEARVTTVHWRFQLSRGEGSRVELCRQTRCITVSARGRSKAFAGLPAEAPFRLRLKRGAKVRNAARLQHGQLIVNFR